MDLYWENLRLHRIIRELKDELYEERRKHDESIDLMMTGEALRSRLMFEAIIGKFPPKLT